MRKTMALAAAFLLPGCLGNHYRTMGAEAPGVAGGGGIGRAPAFRKSRTGCGKQTFPIWRRRCRRTS